MILPNVANLQQTEIDSLLGASESKPKSHSMMDTCMVNIKIIFLGVQISYATSGDLSNFEVIFSQYRANSADRYAITFWMIFF